MSIDQSKSILSAQYGNISTSPNALASIRGHGKYTTNYPMSSNWPIGNSNPNTSSYIRNLNSGEGSRGVNIDLHTKQMPNKNRVNDRFEYPETLNHTLQGDPYQTFGLQANHETPSELNLFFFSKTNVAYLQKRILSEVKNITGIQIKRQSENALLIIMDRNYKLALHGSLPSATVHLALPRGEKSCSLKKRLVRLNQAVIQECVKEILSGMSMYATYYKDASSLPTPLSRPTFMSMKGSNVLSENIGFTKGNSQSIASFNMRNVIMN